MTNQNDSFIDEVTEELRRDRLFRLYRRYGWIVILLIVAMVGWTAWREYSAHRAEQRAQAWGDAVLAANVAPEPAAALAAIDPQGSQGRALLSAMLSAARSEPGEDSAAAAQLREAATAAGSASGPGGAALLDDLALLKAVMEDPRMDLAARDEVLTLLSEPGRPFRLLALEQKAIALIGAGRDEDAAALIRQIQQEDGVSETMRRRLAATLIALGDEEPPAAGDTAAAAAAMPAPATTN